MTALRITTIEISRFVVEEYTVGDTWKEVDLDDPRVRSALLDHVGRYVRVHPDDLEQLTKHGLAVDNGKLLEIEATDPTPPPSLDGEATDPTTTTDPSTSTPTKKKAGKAGKE